MLTITHEQMTALEQDQLRRFKSSFKAEIFERFRQDYPPKIIQHDDQALRAIIDTATQAGLELGIATKGRLSQFVGIAVMVDPVFYQRADVARFLAYSGFTADDKVAILARNISNQLRNIDDLESS